MFVDKKEQIKIPWNIENIVVITIRHLEIN